MNNLDSIKEKLKDFAEKKKSLIKELQSDFSVIVKPIFEKASLIKTIGWRQYSPWNDGEETSFEVNLDTLIINGGGFYEDEYLPEFEVDEALIKEFKELIESIPSDILQDVFGGSNEIIISTNGTINIDRYEDG